MTLDTPAKIRILRSIRNMSQTALAEAANVPQNYVSAIETRTIARYENQLLEALGYAPEMDATLATLAGNGQVAETPA